MLLLFYSDQHLREAGSYPAYNQLDSNGLTKELNNIIAGFKFVADTIRQLKPKRVGALGDLFQNTEQQTARVLHATHIALKLVRDACLEVGAKHDIIPGNHDILNEQHMITSIMPLVGYGNIYNQPNYIDCEGFRIAFLPAISNTGKAYSWLMEAQESCDLICTHMDFAGCRYESGIQSESSLASNWKVPIISGDIHVPQDVGSVHYVGSLVQHKFYRMGLDKVGGVLTFDTTTKKVDRLPNTYSKHYVKVKTVEEGLALDPKRCVLQIVSTKPKEEIDEIFKDYEFFYVKAIEQNPDVKISYSQFSLDDPEKLLRTHVSKERPEALDLYDDIMKGR